MGNLVDTKNSGDSEELRRYYLDSRVRSDSSPDEEHSIKSSKQHHRKSINPIFKEKSVLVTSYD